MNNIEKIATNIVRTLFDAGHTAYFAGGWVRDMLLDMPSTEIDIATSAPPDAIMTLFPKTIPVGIAFGVIIVALEGINFEVTTFRKDHPYHDGRHPDGVDFSSPEKDALRRDFTINGLFYDPLTKTLHDYVGGQEDLQKKVIRAIGNPEERFAEDRLRMIRAVRFAARLGFAIDPATEKAIETHAPKLFPSVSIERIWQELIKMSALSSFDKALLALHTAGLLQTIFPTLKDIPLSTIEKRISFFPYFPLETPTIVYLLELFPKASLEERLSLCRYLKTPTAYQKLVEFFTASETLLAQENPENAQWAHFYAHRDAPLFLDIQTAKRLPPHREQFQTEQTKRQKALAFHITRLKKKQPLVTALLLKRKGVLPSKTMGALLQEAERISINQDLRDPEQILSLLKKSPLWPH